MSIKSSDFGAITDFHFNGGWELECALILPKDRHLAEDCFLDLDGLMHVASDFTPINAGETEKDITFYTEDGIVTQTASMVSGMVYATHAYRYALVTEVGRNPFTDLDFSE